MLGNAGIKANAARGISSAVASAAALPFPMNMAAMSMAYGASSGLFAASLAFAQGNNPELIAPANKMMKYIKAAVNESGGVGSGIVEFTIKGDTLVGVLQKTNRKQKNYR